MKRLSLLIAWCALASFLFAAPLSAQGPIEGEGSMAVGNATVSVGGGTAILTLPDVNSFIARTAPGGGPFIDDIEFSDDFGDEIGWNVTGSVEVLMGANKAVSVSGFWANIEDDDTSTCVGGGTGTCLIFPLVANQTGINQAIGVAPGFDMVSVTDRDVDNWGVSVESRWHMMPGVMGVTQAPNRRYLALGADVRGIDQELDVAISSPQNAAINVRYNEDLDTTYYGAYAAWGGDFPRLLLGGLWERWGLHSTFQLRGGVYYADTDYDGNIIDLTGFAVTPAGSLSLSDDEFAFIGGLVLETKKRIGRRATLSLKSEYEYYSYVPEMLYNQFEPVTGFGRAGGQVGTVINDDDAFSMRSSLRLTIGLGPRTLYQEPMK